MTMLRVRQFSNSWRDSKINSKESPSLERADRTNSRTVRILWNMRRHHIAALNSWLTLNLFWTISKPKRIRILNIVPLTRHIIYLSHSLLPENLLAHSQRNRKKTFFLPETVLLVHHESLSSLHKYSIYKVSHSPVLLINSSHDWCILFSSF